MNARGWLLVGIAAAAALLLVGRAVTTLLVDHAWYAAMGAPGLWWERFADTLILQGGTSLAGSLFAFANLHAVRLTILAVAVPSRVANLELTSMIPARRLLAITMLLSVLVGLALAAPLTDWTTVAMARHGIAFGEIEGYLDRDLGFYLYWLPLEETLYLWALVSVVALTTIVLVLYALTRSLRIDGRRVIVSTHVRRHLSVLGALVLMLLAWSYRLDAFDVLRAGSGPDGLFVRVDHVVTLRVDLALSIMSAVAGLLILRAGWFGQLRMAFITLTIVLVAALGFRHTLPALLARGSTLGEPGRRDGDYQATRTLVSRRAYDVDGIQFGPGDSMSGSVARIAGAETGRAISLWDEAAVRARLTEGNRSPRGVAPVGWHAVGGGITVLFARRVAPGAESWTLRMADATQPVLRDSVIELRGGVAGDDAASPFDQEPVVAPGYAGHRLVSDTSGTVLGTALTSTAARLSHAWATRDPSLLSGDSTASPTTRFVAHRDVRERVALLAPVFALGDDVLPLLHDGILYWTVDLYSASDSYPLSQRWLLAGGIRSYFRHAATALVEAATGRVRLVTVERPDPVARTWMALQPALFTTVRDLPRGLADRLPPATDGAIAQLRTFAQHGSRLEGPIPRIVADSALMGEGPTPHLVGSDGATVLAWSVPLLDSGEEFGGVITAVGGRRRATYWDSSAVPRQRWTAMTERLRLALDSARAALPEGSRREPRVRPGRVQVAITARGPLLLQPLQWNRGDGSIVITRVAVLDGERVGVGMTVQEALARATGRVALPVGPPGTDPAFVETREAGVARLYDAMRQAMRRGDWTRFGSAFDSLGQILGRPPQ